MASYYQANDGYDSEECAPRQLFDDPFRRSPSLQSDSSFLERIGISIVERPVQTVSSSGNNAFLTFCSIISVSIAIIIAVDIITQLVCLAVDTSFAELQEVYLFAYRLYGLMFAVVAFCCEMEWTEVIRTTTILQFWATRGLFYIFLALFTLQEYEGLSTKFMDLAAVVSFVGLALLAGGCLYAIMGLFCSRQIRDQKMTRYLRMLSLYENSGYSDSYVSRAPYQQSNVQ